MFMISWAKNWTRLSVLLGRKLMQSKLWFKWWIAFTSEGIGILIAY
jgi:hypothetical protein